MGDDGSTMTDLLSRTERSSASATPSTAPPPWLTGAGAGAAAAAAGLVSCLGVAVVGWLSGEGGSMTGALRVGAAAWLLGHGAAITTAGAQVTIAPLGLTLLSLLLVWYAARLASAASGVDAPRGVGMVGAAAGFSYAAVVCAVALGMSEPGTSVSVIRAAAVAGLLAGGAACVAAARRCGVDHALLDRLPPDVAPALHGAAVGLAAMLGVSALTLVASLIGHGEALAQMLGALDLGLAGSLLLLLGCLLLLPNATLFAASVLLGPGLAVGTGTQVTLTAVDVGAVPAVPWFAAVPDPGAMPVWATVLAALPVLCGVVAGALAVRGRQVDGHRHACLSGGLAGALAGSALGALVAVSGGSIGPGRMAEVGPRPLSCLAVAVVVMGVGGVLGGLGLRLVTRD